MGERPAGQAHVEDRASLNSGMRDLISIVETPLRSFQRFDYWYQPSTGREIEARVEHAHVVLRRWAEMGITAEEMAEVKRHEDFERDWNAPLIGLANKHGWVRVKVEGFPDSRTLALQSANPRDVRAAAKRYVELFSPVVLYIDSQLYSYDTVWHVKLEGQAIDRYIKTGRVTRNIAEDAAADRANYTAATDILHRLIDHFMSSDPDAYFGMKGFRFSDGLVALTLRGDQIGLTGEDARLWFLFCKQEGYTPDAFFSRFKKSRDPMIKLAMFDNHEDVDEITRKVVYSTVAHDILLHEIVHYLDSKRDGDWEGRTRPKSGSADYYNSGTELNAYFNNVAEPLLRFINMAKETQDDPAALARMAETIGIHWDFRETFASLVRKIESPGAVSKMTLRKFLNALRGKNRKRIIARLYALHREAVALMDGKPVTEGEVVPFPRRPTNDNRDMGDAVRSLRAFLSDPSPVEDKYQAGDVLVHRNSGEIVDVLDTDGEGRSRTLTVKARSTGKTSRWFADEFDPAPVSEW